jgi:hypothetical protein
MMAITKLSNAPERGTKSITLSDFLDEADATATMKTLSWTLVDLDGAVVNSRTAVALTPAASVSFVLSGDDLALSGSTSKDRKRRVTIKGTYDSDLGTDLPLTAEVEFEIDQFIGIT